MPAEIIFMDWLKICRGLISLMRLCKSLYKIKLAIIADKELAKASPATLALNTITNNVLKIMFIIKAAP